MSERLTYRGHHFTVLSFRDLFSPMHVAPSDERSSHAVGGARLRTRGAMMAALDKHLDAYEDTGNCRGYVPVQLKPFGTIHIGVLDLVRADGPRTLCGLRMPGPAGACRVLPGRLERVTCHSCPSSVFLP